MNNRRVVVGMSGGVDSSVTAHLLQRQGFEVIGVTLKLWPQDCAALVTDKCCGPQAVRDARGVAHQLGIPHYVLDQQEWFQQQVVDYFVLEYRAGRTPNPCIRCNEQVKFGSLLQRAREMGADYVATGHYARIERAGANGSRRFLLHRGRDRRKDQSYFLFSLRQDQLASALMPLGELTKSDTRRLASELGLRVHDKEESMEICFVPENDYGRFLRESGRPTPREGEILDTAGRVLGRHPGIEYFTVGQRRGLRVAGPKPWYVVALDPQRNRVIVGHSAELLASELVAEQVRWIPFDHPERPVSCTVQIRHNHPGAPATVTDLGDGRARVRFEQPQRAVTPGQAAVFYDGDRVLGGGWIGRP